MPGNEVDETSRSYQQFLQMILHLSYQYARTRQRLPKMTRAQYKQFQHELEERMRFEQHDRANTVAWYKSRVADYQREAADLAARHKTGEITDEERLKATAYMQGLRAGIERTVHDITLTSEERGQVVQALDAIDVDPQIRMEHGVFRPMTKREKAVARQDAARSEAAAIEHREEQAARQAAAAAHDAPADATGSFSALKKANAALTKQVAKLTSENTALQTQVQTLQAQLDAKATAGAEASTNGHGTHQAEQQAQDAEHEAPEVDIDPDQADGGSAAQMEAEA
ncbi:hypothetical protein HLB23_39445 [Nocardia uniformis]|uniref:Uncharacterized protein n=1 Tax=Nocardia uniformis TaxID=53432 RepID=A0A849CAJ8_9NOCA|nr:hypothetical protein [Nocardia uniformis]NNH75863.1 hypothetical protein [Nocardia uniformis]